MCNFCEGTTDVIHTFKFNNVKLEIFLEDNELTLNTFDHNNFDITEDICDSFKINNCPMCGKSLNE